MVSRPDGSVVFESRAEQGLSIDHVNLREKQRFMSGEKVGPGAGQQGAQVPWVLCKGMATRWGEGVCACTLEGSDPGDPELNSEKAAPNTLSHPIPAPSLWPSSLRPPAPASPSKPTAGSRTSGAGYT